MEEEYEISNNLLDNVNKVPKKGDSCCYKFFCCLCLWFESNNTDKKKYIKKWREYLNKESERDISCFRAITNLWAHKNVIEDLEKVRLNPNLVCTKGIRNDLEFYIPQICTFLIFGDYERVEELLAFLCKACYGSFFFAHRILWFLKSLLNIKSFTMHHDKIYQRIILVESIYKSEKDNYSLEKLNIPNSKKYLDFIKKRNLEFLFNLDKINNEEIQKNKSSNFLLYDKMTSEFLKNYAMAENIKKDFILKHFEFLDDLKQDGKNNIKEFSYNYKIKPEEVFIRIFGRNSVNTSVEYKQTLAFFQDSNQGSILIPSEENINAQDEFSSKLNLDLNFKNDVNLKAFLSTINFMDILSNICKDAFTIPQDEQIIFIKREISDLNKELPSNVYIPFLKNSIRNHLVVHMPISEIKIFRTKTRVLYMTVVELVRIDEILNQIETIENEKVKNISNNFESSLNNPENGSNRGRSYSMATSYNEFKEKKKIKKKKVKQEESKKINKNNAFLNLLDESEINISRPITIDSLLHEKSKTNTLKKENKNNNKTVIEEDLVIDLNESSLHGKEIENMIKRRITQSSRMQKRMSVNFDTRYAKKNSKSFINGGFDISPNELDENNLMNENKLEVKNNDKDIIFNKIQAKFDMAQLNNNKNKEKSFDINEIDIIKETDLNKFTSLKNEKRSNSFYSVKGEEIHDDENDMEKVAKMKIIEDQKGDKILTESSNNGNLPTNYDANIDFKNIFGELIDEQSERIRKFSPFGSFNTWKICKIIVKSGEDLIQEQFATQLINEFYQIFRIENVDCWVNTYEILSTGNESGIIECVTNAISIDELKKKIKNLSLREFFINYFGPVDSKKFKDAMNNFIQSLAGYSLLCYFLQIKDRHNANIMIDNNGRIIHIDFGFLLSNSPGKGIKFERAPFKLTNEFVECMGGINSKVFKKFRNLLWKGFVSLVKHSQNIIILVEMMYLGFGDTLGCFINKEDTINELKNRFFPQPNMDTKDYFRHVDSLIEQSINNWRTNWYDKCQYYLQGILY